MKMYLNIKECIILIIFISLICINGYAYVTLDDFEQNNKEINSIGESSGTETGAGVLVYYYPDVTFAAKNGLRGGNLRYDDVNGNGIIYFNNFSDSGALDLSFEDVLKFWIRALKINEGYDSRDSLIEYIRLEGTNSTIWGRAPFATYNAGSEIVSTNWTEIAIPMDDFTSDTSNGFSLNAVHRFVIDFEYTSHVQNLYVDDFENPYQESNPELNDVWGWSGFGYKTPNSYVGYFPDTAQDAKSGLKSGYIEYTNYGYLKYQTELLSGPGSEDISSHDTLKFWVRSAP